MPLNFDTEKCARCDGRGRIDIYRNIAGGVCAKCAGGGRRTSKAGNIARVAFERAVTAATGIAVTDVTEGMTLADGYGGTTTVAFVKVEACSSSGRPVYYVHAASEHSTRTSSVGYGATRIVLRYMPDTVAAIAQRIADRFEGATLKGAPAPAAPAAVKPAPAAAPMVDRTRDLALLTFDRYATRAAA